ncbi:MAG: DUF4157 domain-containing protein [Anaerolineales bacterium]|nr:DUF4157 domain-containing protein [Anaerolineales bacterium]
MASKDPTQKIYKATTKQHSDKQSAENFDIPSQVALDPADAIRKARSNPHLITPGDVLQLQRSVGNRAVGQFLNGMAEQRHPSQPRHADTGLPEDLRAGVENLSGLAMEDVQVHYNSDVPAKIASLAFTEGKEIHIAPGQEKQLPHEAWHVVQQKQGKVTPSMRLQRHRFNADSRLEAEADVMSKKASRLSLAHRLPSTEQVDHAMQQLGHPVHVAQRNVPVSPARQFRCGLKGKEKSQDLATPQEMPQMPSLQTTQELTEKQKEKPDPNTLEGLTTLMRQKRGAGENVTPETLQHIWKHEKPDPTGERLFKDYGVDPWNQLPYETGKESFTAMVPPGIIQGLKGDDDSAKLDTIFQRINKYSFSYAGTHYAPEIGFTSKTGDCQTLAEMLILAAKAAGITGVTLEPQGGQTKRLVPARKAHGRPGKSNENSGRYWAFDTHFWAEYKGAKYDLLFMTKADVPAHYETGSGVWKDVPYTIYDGGRCFIAQNAAEKLGVKMKANSQGIAFNSEDELMLFVNRYKPEESKKAPQKTSSKKSSETTEKMIGQKKK